MKDNPFDSEEADAILGGNVAICEYFATKSVKQTVRANLNYYKNINQFIKDEQSDTYSKIYVVIQIKLEKYFACAAEDILKDVYGEKYDTFFVAQTAEFGEKAKKNSPRKNAE